MSIDFTNGKIHKERNDDFGIGRYMKFWPIVVAIIAMVSGWAVLNATVGNHEKRITTIEDKIESIPVIAANVQQLLDLAQADEKRRRWREDRGERGR